jgi:hypothetical protein
MFNVNVTWHPSKNPDTIWNKLAAKLGRQPTNAEACAEVRRILEEVTVERAMAGKLPHQRKARAKLRAGRGLEG